MLGVELTKSEAAVVKQKTLLEKASTEDESAYSAATEIASESDEAYELARTSLDFLAGLAMPTVFRFLFPPVFKMVWEWLLSYVHRSRVFPRLALGLPRGFGKTTLVKIFILFCILFTKKRFILITCATGPLAENMLADVIHYLEEPNIKRLFGDWKTSCLRDAQAIKRFGFRGKDMIIAALGQGGAIRGLNLGDVRPDLMIFDDIQTRECANSLAESHALEQWLYGTAMKAKDPFGCMYIFIGNMYPTKYSILRKLKKNPKWVKFIAGGILADGTSLWEELQPIEQLLDEYEADSAAGHPEIFHAEVLNDENAAANNLINLSNLPENPFNKYSIPAGKFILIDPSNDKANSDAVSIGSFHIYDGKPAMMSALDSRLSPGDTIKEALNMALTLSIRVIVIEAQAYQYSLLYWFNYFIEKLGITGIYCIPIYSGSLSKNTKILNTFKAYASGELYVHEDAKDQVHAQILQFQPLRRDNVDGLLDLLGYAPRVIEEHGAFIVSLNEIIDQETSGVQVYDELTSSCF